MADYSTKCRRCNTRPSDKQTRARFRKVPGNEGWYCAACHATIIRARQPGLHPPRPPVAQPASDNHSLYRPFPARLVVFDPAIHHCGWGCNGAPDLWYGFDRLFITLSRRLSAPDRKVLATGIVTTIATPALLDVLANSC